jgi:hypothetical protein
MLRAMKRIVGFNLYQGVGLIAGALLLVWILEAETVISNLVMFGLVAVLAWQELVRRRRARRNRAHPDAGRGA